MIDSQNSEPTAEEMREISVTDLITSLGEIRETEEEENLEIFTSCGCEEDDLESSVRTAHYLFNSIIK